MKGNQIRFSPNFLAIPTCFTTTYCGALSRTEPYYYFFDTRNGQTEKAQTKFSEKIRTKWTGFIRWGLA